jgi:hypothetical protein
VKPGMTYKHLQNALQGNAVKRKRGPDMINGGEGSEMLAGNGAGYRCGTAAHGIYVCLGRTGRSSHRCTAAPRGRAPPRAHLPPARAQGQHCERFHCEMTNKLSVLPQNKWASGQEGCSFIGRAMPLHQPIMRLRVAGLGRHGTRSVI